MRRSMRLALLPLAALLTATAVDAAAPEQSNSVDELAIERGHKQLLLDDRAIESRTNLTRTMHRPTKHGAVVRPDGKADGIRLQAGSAPFWVPEEQRYRFYYMGFPYLKGKGQWVLDDIGPAMVVSTDGLHWERPELGRVEVGGSKQNNRFSVLDPNTRWSANRFVEVIFTPDDPDPARRYKGFLGAINRQPVVSPNGLDWSKVDTPPIRCSDTSVLIHDEMGDRYMAVVKTGTKYGRSAAVTFSDDFVHWTKPRLTFSTDQQDQVIAKRRIANRLADPDMQNPMFNFPEPDEAWAPGRGNKPSGPIDGEDFNQTGTGKDFNIPTWRAETYKMAIFPYEGLYIGIVQLYFPTGPAIPAWNNTLGFNEFQLAFSRDGQLRQEQWNRLGDREPWLETSPLSKGLVGNFDRQQMSIFNRPLVMGDELWFYYTGYKGRTPPYKMWPDGTVRDQADLTAEEEADFDDGWAAVCLAKLRLDGFVSLRAADEAGELITKPLTARGDELLLNLDAHAGGGARVEVLDTDGEPIDGFTFANSQTLTGSGVRQPVHWEGPAEWKQLEGKTVRLRIVLRRADLYAFWMQ